MKTKLLTLSLLFSTFLFGQAPINSFYGDNNSIFESVTNPTPLDHSATGANQTWNFNTLVPVAISTRTYTTPSTAESTTYPGTTSVINNSTVANAVTTIGKMFTKNLSGTVSITGLESTGLVVNFSTNNATLGLFPMNFNYTNTDSNVAGNYSYDTYDGTFTGTLVTTVDAYGTLSLNDTGSGAYTGTVTRMKNVLTISLNYGFLTNVGTITQTSYSYYDGTITSNNPIFRSITTAALVPLANIDQTDVTLERFVQNPLANPVFQLQNILVMNPVANDLIIQTPTSIEKATLTILDVSGKILRSELKDLNNYTTLPFDFAKGIYILKISNQKETIVKKIIKK